MARSPSARRARNLHVETRHHRLLRPGHLHLQLCGARPVQPRLRHRRPGARLRPGRRAYQPCQRRTPDRPRSPARPAGGMAAGDPRARRPPVGGHLPAARTGRAPGHRRANHPGAGEILRPVQPGRGVPGGRPPVRAPVRGRRVVPHRRPGMPRAAYPGAYPGVHDLPGRRQRLRRRYPVHARLRHRPLRFPRRRRAPAVSLDPAPVRATRRDPPVHVPRLHGSRPRRAPLRNQRRRAAPAQRARPRRRRRGGVRRHAPAARCHPRHAVPDAAGDPGQHARRQPAAGGRQRGALPEDPLDLF
ncbi:Uncharacterized protein conserved in bacteria [Pseudomonas aeruginosa]|nr:Uncharacterized protein conserved in bacteria [Pseudomonas aeruginosa]